MLCIATTMSASLFEVQGQNRRTATTNQKEQSSAAAVKSNVPEMKVAPAKNNQPAQTTTRQTTTRQSTSARQTTATSARQTASNSSKNTAARQTGTNRQTSASSQVQDRRTTATTSNVPKTGATSTTSRRTGVTVNNSRVKAPAPQPRPAAVQYHNNPPAKRPPEYERPFLAPKAKPAPSYVFGNHSFGSRVKVLPRGYATLDIGRHTYYYYGGIYYRKYWFGGYYIVRPPKGTEIASTLMNIALTAAVINTINNAAERAANAAALSAAYATRAASATAVSTLPAYTARTADDYLTLVTDQEGQQYYYEDGVFYVLSNGQYYVIEPPIGALVTQIPADYDEIELDGETYYMVEETLYRTTIIEGALYFEVVSNL